MSKHLKPGHTLPITFLTFQSESYHASFLIKAPEGALML